MYNLQVVRDAVYVLAFWVATVLIASFFVAFSA